MFKQCCGRGARAFDKTANVEVIVKAGTKLARCTAEQIENELDDLETGNNLEEGVKAIIWEKLDGKQASNAAPKVVDECHKILTDAN